MKSIETRRSTCRPRYVPALVRTRWGHHPERGLGGHDPNHGQRRPDARVWGEPGVAPPTAPAAPPYYPPSHFYPCPRVWVPGYYDAYSNWVFGYSR